MLQSVPRNGAPGICGLLGTERRWSGVCLGVLLTWKCTAVLLLLYLSCPLAWNRRKIIPTSAKWVEEQKQGSCTLMPWSGSLSISIHVSCKELRTWTQCIPLIREVSACIWKGDLLDLRAWVWRIVCWSSFICIFSATEMQDAMNINLHWK